MNKKFVSFIFIGLVLLTLLTPFWVFKDLLFPFVTSKAYYLRILVEITLPFYLLLFFVDRDYRPSLKNPLTISVLAFFLFNLLAALFGVNVLRSIWGNFERMGGVFYLGHLVLLYFYVLMIGQINARYLRVFLQCLLGIGAAVSLDGIMVELTHNHFLLSDPSYPRVSGTFGNPIFIASFLVVPMFLAAFFAVSEQVRWKKIMYWALFIIQGWVIFLSGTRGAVVGLGIGIFIAAVLYIILTPIRRLRVWGGSALLAFSLVLLLLFSLHSHLPQGTLLRRVFNLDDTNTKSRLIQWGVALRGYKDHPLLGVGPENYYIISNKYYNPEIFQYDQSWFDKPHNYLIEVLVTGGIFGFLAYLSILVFSLWALWAAYRKEILILSEFCILVCALLAYQIQNLTVFDTVGASVAFFSYIGFMSYLWYEFNRAEKAPKKGSRGLASSFCYAIFALSAVIMAYVIYVANITGIEVAKEINFGYAYASVDPQIAKNYFEQARNSPFDFDPIQFSSKYAEFADGLAQNPGSQSTAFVSQNLNDAIAVQQEALAIVTDPTGWQELANLYLSQAIYNKTALDPAAVVAAQKSIALAPLRPEGNLLLARLDLYQQNSAGAEGLLRQIITEIPQDSAVKMLLAFSYAYSGQTAQGLVLGQSALDAGYMPGQASEVAWMADAYQKENNFAAAAGIYQILIKLDPTDLQSEWMLAQDEAKIGNTQEAIQITQSLIQSDPKDASHFQDFINSLK